MNELFDSIGVEIEYDTVSRRDIKLPSGFNFTSDASVESNRWQLGDIRVWKSSNKIPLQSVRAGGEIKSVILGIDNIKTHLEDLCYTLKNAGESPKSVRAGIHIHLNAPDLTLNMLKSLVKTGAILEPVFFALGCMGYKYRGITNNSTYCRPITAFGPPVVPKASGGLAQVVNLQNVWSAETRDDFFYFWGDAQNQVHSGGHMFPVRYLWLNFASLLTQNTVEFRIFNKSLCSEKIWAVAVFCNEILKYSVKHSFTKKYMNTWDENSIYYVNEKPNVLEIFNEFVYNWGMPEEAIDILRCLLDDADYDSIKVEPGFFYTHLQFHASGNMCRDHWKKEKNEIGTIPHSLVNKPVFFDSHNITSTQLLRMSPIFQEY